MPSPPPPASDASLEQREAQRARQQGFTVHQTEPLNAEPSPSELARAPVTPLAHFFHRNHDALLRAGDTDGAGAGAGGAGSSEKGESAGSPAKGQKAEAGHTLTLSISRAAAKRIPGGLAARPRKAGHDADAGAGAEAAAGANASANAPTDAAAVSSSADDSDDSAPARRAELTVPELKRRYKRVRFAAAIECAGNRRAAFDADSAGGGAASGPGPGPGQEGGAEEQAGTAASPSPQPSPPRATEGLPWRGGVVASLVWAGAPLRRVLRHELGVPDPFAHHQHIQHGQHRRRALSPRTEDALRDAAPWARGLHVHFVSAQLDGEAEAANEQDNEGRAAPRYGASVPLALALHPSRSALLAYAHNGAPLAPAHGAPLRAVLPGVIGARWVKYLARVEIRDSPSDAHAMREDYKILEQDGAQAQQEGEEQDAPSRQQQMEALPPLQELGIGSDIASPRDGERIVLRRPRVPSSGPSPSTSTSASASASPGAAPRGTFRARGYALGAGGEPATDVQVLLLPDAGAAASNARLRAAAAQAPHAEWRSAELQRRLEGEGEGEEEGDEAQEGQERGGRRDKDEHDDSDSEDDAPADGVAWDWTLWHCAVPVPPGRSSAGDGGDSEPQRWALVARAATRSAVQEQESAWNVRGFAYRAWPVVRGLQFVEEEEAQS